MYFLTVGPETPVAAAMPLTDSPLLALLLISSTLSTPIISFPDLPMSKSDRIDNCRSKAAVGAGLTISENFRLPEWKAAFTIFVNQTLPNTPAPSGCPFRPWEASFRGRGKARAGAPEGAVRAGRAGRPGSAGWRGSGRPESHRISRRQDGLCARIGGTTICVHKPTSCKLSVPQVQRACERTRNDGEGCRAIECSGSESPRRATRRNDGDVWKPSNGAVRGARAA